MSPRNPSPLHNLVIGVLELQGDFAEHTAMLRQCGAGTVVGIRQPDDLVGLDAVVIPGGESTTISKLLVEQHMLSALQSLAATHNLPIFGTCAGCILLASRIRQRDDQPRIGALDVTIDRNAYGSQIDSFEAFVEPACKALADGKPLRVVHIRAPAIKSVGKGVEVLASYKDSPILVRQGNLLGCTFHPELTDDLRIHSLFLRMVADHKALLEQA